MTNPYATQQPPPSQRVIDVCGLKCPMPILKTKKALADMAAGEILEIRATDPAAEEDFRAFARQTGHQLRHVSETAGIFTFFLQRK